MTLELRIVATNSTRQPGDQRHGGGYQLLYDAPRKSEDDDEDHIVKDDWQTTTMLISNCNMDL
jgi:hypothetical protein